MTERTMAARQPGAGFLRRNVSYAVAIAVLAVLPLVLRNPYYAHVLIMFFFYAFLAMAWNVIGGYGGQLSLGHAVFYGLGAYTSTLLFVHFHLSPWLGMLAGGALAVAVSVIIGFPCFRLHGPFFSMSTLAVCEVFRILTVYFSGLTQGSVGVSIPIEFGLGNMIFEGKTGYLYIIIGFFALAVVLAKWIERSRFGYALIALREDEDAAESAGVNVSRTKLKAIMVSAFLTAMAGTFFAQYSLYIDPGAQFSLELSVLIAVMAILGGVGTVFGPVLGAALLVPLQEILRAWLGGQLYGLHLFVYGVLLIAVVIFLPNGIYDWLKRSKKASPESRDAISSPAAAMALAAGAPAADRAGDLILKTRKVCKSFGGLMAVSELDFDVPRGTITGLIGPNGAGKTTFFNLISGFCQPDSGTIEYQGRDIGGVRPAHKLCRRGIGRTFQIVKPFGNITVLQNVMVGAFSHLSAEKEAREYASDVLAFVDLFRKRDSLGKSLTIGDRKRLELARALATRPDLILLDEIMAGLNPAEIEAAIRLIRRIRDQGVTVILIEHVMRAVMNLSDQVVILHHGQKICEGTPQMVASDERVIKAYLGEEYVLA